MLRVHFFSKYEMWFRMSHRGKASSGLLSYIFVLWHVASYFLHTSMPYSTWSKHKPFAGDVVNRLGGIAALLAGCLSSSWLFRHDSNAESVVCFFPIDTKAPTIRRIILYRKKSHWPETFNIVVPSFWNIDPSIRSNFNPKVRIGDLSSPSSTTESHWKLWVPFSNRTALLIDS